MWMKQHSNKQEFVRMPPGKQNDPRYTMKTVKNNLITDLDEGEIFQYD